MDDPAITMEEYMHLEEERARRRGQNFDRKSATYGKVKYFKDIDYFKDFKAEFPAIVFNDTLISELEIHQNPLIPFDPKRFYKDGVCKSKNCGGQDMAGLPPRAQRHLWLRYGIEGYDEGIVQDYELRLATIFSRQVNQSDTELGLDIVDTLCFQLGAARRYAYRVASPSEQRDLKVGPVNNRGAGYRMLGPDVDYYTVEALKHDSDHSLTYMQETLHSAISFYIFFLHILQPIQKLEKQSNECTQEVLVDPESNAVADVTAKKITPNASGVAPEQISVDSRSRNSLDGNWGSVFRYNPNRHRKMLYVKENDEDTGKVSNDGGSFDASSVLSTATLDADSTEKPKVNPTKPVVADCIVEPEVKDSKKEPSPEDLTKVNNKSKAKKSMTLKNLLDEAKSPPKLIEDGKKGRKNVKGVRSWVPCVCRSAKSPSAKKTDHAAKKDEAVNDKQGDPMSPPKLIKDGKKGQKKVKGVRSWVPFVCCSSVNVIN
ncbi:hypothetical protein Tco_0393760 [Tanacetum coccineum]